MICQRVAFAGVARPLARRAREWIAALCVLIAAVMLLAPQDASAQDCSRAGARGAAPSSWQTYCWLNMSNYSDAQARSTGQPMSYVLPDGSRLTFRLQVAVTPTATGTALVSAAAPSWTGAAVGNSSFLNIPGRPILYQATNGTVTTLTLTNIAIIPPGGVSQANQYAFVVADAESTDNSEYQQYTTNGGAWQLLDRVAPRSGTQYPVSTGINTTTFRTAGGGQTGNVGAYIVSSLNPTSVTITMQGSGLQGVMLAIRFASITLSKTIAGTRIADNDQFRFVIESQNGATTYASGQTSGTDLGPFPAAVFSSTSGVPLVLREAMVAGSTSALADYRASLTCTNINSGSTTSLPRDVVTNSYNFGTLQFGDFVDCVFTNTPLPRLQLRTAIAAPGRIFGTDQFTLAIRNQTANTELASFTTTGTGTTATPGNRERFDRAGPLFSDAGMRQSQCDIDDGAARGRRDGSADPATWGCYHLHDHEHPVRGTADPFGRQDVAHRVRPHRQRQSKGDPRGSDRIYGDGYQFGRCANGRVHPAARRYTLCRIGMADGFPTGLYRWRDGKRTCVQRRKQRRLFQPARRDRHRLFPASTLRSCRDRYPFLPFGHAKGIEWNCASQFHPAIQDGHRMIAHYPRRYAG